MTTTRDFVMVLRGSGRPVERRYASIDTMLRACARNDFLGEFTVFFQPVANRGGVFLGRGHANGTGPATFRPNDGDWRVRDILGNVGVA